MTPPKAKQGLPMWDKPVHCHCVERCACEEAVNTYREALSIALEAIVQARRWNNIAGLSAEGALEQVEIDLSVAMRRIEELK